ncbi:MSHA biogenesis protein MshK [Pseudoduganella sp. LjRoot289]|uniref:MSHA biogenesis protein MshK n=1 Tax=Pseudoduganella sp. LjRoot289 TaxID=3342314 RepID=UPI003ECF1E39
MSAILKTLLCGLVCCCTAALAQVPPPNEAGGLGDPTRPPAALAAPGGAVAAGATGEDGAQSEAAAPRLQSILVSREPGGRRVAVINGEMVRQGMKIGGATVVRVGETEVVLRRGKSLETLKLFPKQ